MSNSSTSISIICVFNNLSVREQCLDRSIAALSCAGDDVEYIPVDNVASAYPTAGAALNHGVSLAKNNVIVLAHQDVYLHSLLAIKRAAAQMQPEGFGVIGAIGRGPGDCYFGRIRDRFYLLGESVSRLTEVDSLDEVLFMAPRRQLLSEPIADIPELAWHAYAVEYGLRMRRKGLRTGVADMPLTHNSLSLNVERLDVAHQVIARSYPEFLPVGTTCGDITDRIADDSMRARISGHLSYRYRSLRDSLTAQRSRATADEAADVIVDLRHEIDRIIERAPGKELRVINCSTGNPFTPNVTPVELPRRGGALIFSDASISEMPAIVADAPPFAWVLITGLADQDARFLQATVAPTSYVTGFHDSAGLWLLIGPDLADLPESWRLKKAATRA